MDKVCHQLPPEEVYKQFGRVSKLLIHPKDVPDIGLLMPQKVINCIEEIAEVNCEAIHKKELNREQIGSDNIENLIYRKEMQKKFVGSSTAGRVHAQISKKKRDLLNRLGSSGNHLGFSNAEEGEFTQGMEKTVVNTFECGIKNSKKSLICYQHESASMRVAQGVELQEYVMTVSWASDNSKNLFNRLNWDGTLSSSVCGE